LINEEPIDSETLTAAAKSYFSEENPQYGGIYWGGISTAGAQAIVDWSDGVVCIGALFNDYSTLGWTPMPQGPVVMLMRSEMVRQIRPLVTAASTIIADTGDSWFSCFVRAGLPHARVRTNNIDAYELNLPLADVHLSKLVLDEWNTANGNVRLLPIISSAPFLYAGSWHQPLSYIEVVFNREYWRSLDTARNCLIDKLFNRNNRLWAASSNLDDIPKFVENIVEQLVS
jgi:hypothetical protein